jgi:RNA polymerase sigma factor (TIGR02999 family)
MLGGMSDVTRLIDAAKHGDNHAAAELLPLVYDELRKLAAARMAEEKPGQTLQATALVHEAYLRLVGGDQPGDWSGRGHFFAAAAEAMRRILVNQARDKGRLKRGGGRRREELVDLSDPASASPDNLLDLSDALDRLAAAYPASAEVVKLRFFAGLTIEESATVLGISPRTVVNRWEFAQAWLFKALSAE